MPKIILTDLQKEENREFCRLFRLAFPEKNKDSARRSRARHIEQRRLDSRTWYYKNREYSISQAIQWAKNNKERDSVTRRKRAKRKRLTDPNYRLRVNLRTRIGMALQGTLKSDKTINLIGCPIEHLWMHLESKFTQGMSRENYGKIWHVDHVRPCASFSLSDPEQQRECFNFKNLQPMFAIDNIKKGDKVIL